MNEEDNTMHNENTKLMDSPAGRSPESARESGRIAGLSPAMRVVEGVRLSTAGNYCSSRALASQAF
ncbi:MAG: hypothetical protein Q4F72_05845 [Desulfovibrionaceae bacterium]|nr:hypothetical protein [Desulfovibrionaceae bacterium]